MSREATTITFNENFFEALGRDPRIVQLCNAAATQIATRALARAAQHRDTGDYMAGIRVVRADRHGRVCFLVIADDWKSLILEARYGILARSIKA